MTPQEWSRIQQGIFKGESGGDYGALFGYQNRPGGKFSNIDLTKMTIDEALEFANPSGNYGQFVKGQVGRVATPMGAYQVVGSTLRDAKKGLGLSGQETMSKDMQDQIGRWIYKTQGTGAWEGYKPLSDDQAIASQTLQVLGKSPKGILAPTQTSETETKPMMNQQKPRGLLENIGIQKMQEGAEGETGQRFYNRDSFKDTAATLAQGFGRMGIMGMEEIADQVAGQRSEAKARNKTVAYLRKANRNDLADAVEGGSLGARDAAGIMFAQPKEKFTQVKGSAIGLTGPQADRMFNVGASGKITAIGGSAPVTNLNTPAEETAWSKGMGEFGVKTFENIQNEALSAQDMLSNTVVLENLMKDPDFTSGALVEPTMAYKKVIEALGGEAANVGSLEAFRAVTSKLILDQMGGSLGAGFSEGDRKFVEGMGAQLSTSIEGNKMIIQMNRQIGKRKLEIASFADRYVQENGKIDKEFMGALRKWSKENPLFAAIDPNSYL